MNSMNKCIWRHQHRCHCGIDSLTTDSFRSKIKVALILGEEKRDVEVKSHEEPIRIVSCRSPQLVTYAVEPQTLVVIFEICYWILLFVSTVPIYLTCSGTKSLRDKFAYLIHQLTFFTFPFGLKNFAPFLKCHKNLVLQN